MDKHTLKLRDAELVLPGLALPEAFESLEKQLDSTVKLTKLRSPPDGQILSLITICQELQRLLKCAFIENGFLASRLEIFTRYHSESLKKINKTVSSFDLDHKVTKKQIKRLRKRVSVHDTYQRKKNEKWWDVEVKSTDYETFNALSRSSGSPDLEFMLRINQILIDFVRDQDKTELVLPPMGNDERGELAKLASIYKIRCRYGKSTQLASSTLMKARQTCIPGHGEVDTILDGFARAQNLKRLTVTAEEGVPDEAKQEVVITTTEEVSLGSKRKSKSPPISTIPSTMLTPLSSLTSPTIDISGITSATMTPSHSPPASAGVSGPPAVAQRRESSDKERAKAHASSGSRSSAPQSNENPLPSTAPRSAAGGGNVGGGVSESVKGPHPPSHTTPASSHLVAPPTNINAPAAPQGGTSVSGSLPSSIGPLTSLHMSQPKPPHSLPPRHPGVGAGLPTTQPTSSSAQQPTTNPLVGGLLLQHAHHPSLRQMGHSTVVASPLKVPVSQLPHVVKHSLSMASAAGGGGAGKPPEPSGEPGRGGGLGGGGGGSEGGVGRYEGGGAATGETDVGQKREPLVSPPTSAQPLKRIRLTRKTAGLASNED